MNGFAMKTSLLLATILLASLGLAGCHPAARLDVPPNFAETDDSAPYALRVESARDVVIAVRAEPNRPRASLDFWADSIDLRLRRQGYSGDAPRDVRSVGGLDGKQLRYAREDQGRTYRYWLTVFATADRVYVVEAGGDRENFDPAQEQIQAAVLSLRPQ
jgi:hypothetical protein